MLAGMHAVPVPSANLKERVCGAEGGLTLEELLLRWQSIVEASAAQWRLGALFELSQAWDPSDAAHRDFADIRASLPEFLDLARAIRDEALLRGFPGVREAAQAFDACLQQLSQAADEADTCARIADLAETIARLEDALIAGSRG